ncbi:uncharacterized protein LOC106167942 [Lingula anatina]|uniref:Uncharacterized protein LOC106167942 n=1 Tax=Lingula anatina TaxID=7574 RepID=A0A1S3IWF8_LINAN|nr:uncharacterized protein LOC106167942 [Lingula anatina]XP_013402303.1 uncharacterized protein LOC106167942 [Lingula anatina]|eukprot:XP_013402301.1 uncharacterized protein LOC106167942 [Lingula anatina]
MSDQFRNLIQINEEILCKHLEPHRVLYRMSNVFTSEDEKQILDGVTASERSRILLQCLMTKEPWAFEVFIGALEDLGLMHLVELLRAGLHQPGISRSQQPGDANLQDDSVTSSSPDTMVEDVTKMDELKVPVLESAGPGMITEQPTFGEQPHVRESAEGASATTEYFGLDFSSNPAAYKDLAALPMMTEEELETFSNNLNISAFAKHVFKGEKNIKEVLEAVDAVSPKTDLGLLITALVTCNRRDLADLLQSFISQPLESTKDQKPFDKESKKKLEQAELHISQVPFSKINEIVCHVSITSDDGKDWRLAAELMGIENYQNLIALWAQSERRPFEKVLACWEKKMDATVGKLHEILLAIGHERCASLLMGL